MPWLVLVAFLVVVPFSAWSTGLSVASAPFRGVILVSPPRYQQTYISSCEAAATHIALQMAGVDVPEQRLIAELPADPRPPVYNYRGVVVRWGDPYRSFVGDITRGDTWPLVGYGVYTPPILHLLRLHGMDVEETRARLRRA